MKNVLTIPSIVAGSKNGGAGGTNNYDDLINQPKVNGVTLSGNKTSADLGITTLTPFPSTWPTTGKFEDLLAVIRNDTTAIKGASFLDEVTFDDLPANLGNAEVRVEILEGTTSATKVIHSVITSGNREPYRWEYTSWNSGNSNSGWISFQLPLTAGTGISIENNVISATGAEKYGIKGDYASKYGIINAQNGLIAYASDSKEVTVKAGIQLLMPGSDTKTQIGSDIKYTINSTSDVTLFLADGEIKEAEGVYFQTEEPENGQEAYLAWYNPEVGKWQFKSNDDGNVWRTPTKAGPLADVHLSETGVIRVDYVGYRVLNDQIFALKSDLPVNAYTAANLVAGKNITIEEVLPEGGIDVHTMGCWHFDGNNENAVVGSEMTSSSTSFDTDGKFGSCAKTPTFTGWMPKSSDDYTWDFWFKTSTITGYDNGQVGGIGNYATYKYGCFYKQGEKLYAVRWGDSINEQPFAILQENVWTHVALTRQNNIERWFVNGELIRQGENTYNVTSNEAFKSAPSADFDRIDEYRISNIARPLTADGKFPVPTQPYSLAVPTGKTAINNAITKTSQLINDSGFITSVNSKTGNVILTGADIQTTYTANPEVTETTTSDVNTALTSVCEDIHNVLTNVPTGAELMSTTVYPYQAPLTTDATLADVVAKVNTILAIMSERGIMKKSS